MASLLVASTAFLSSFLLFVSEPLIAKTLLPFFGGSASVWISCLAFFQIALLGGYLYAHWLSQRPFRQQAICHTLLLILSSACLPPRLRAWTPFSEPSTSVFFTLLLSIGLPFFTLASHTPLLQSWKAHRISQEDPYQLAIPSNIACVAALLCFPLLLETRFPLSILRWMWSGGYGILVVLMCLTAGALYRRQDDTALPLSIPDSDFKPARAEYRSWLLLSSVPAALLSATTLYLSTQVAPIPLLWTLPLALYLLTFAIAFARWGAKTDSILNYSAIPLAAVWAGICLSQGIPIRVLIALHLICFFGITLACHRLLVKRRPPQRDLTHFYIAIALGGAIGGFFEAVIFPMAFRGFLEFPLLILASVALLRWLRPKELNETSRLTWLSVWNFCFGMAITALIAHTGLESTWPLPVAILASVVLVGLVFRTFPVGIGALVGIPLFFICQKYNPVDTVVDARRSFYGIHRIYLNPARTAAWLSNGTTIHGGQWRIPHLRQQPIGYYDRTGPLGDIFRLWGPHRPQKHIGVIGLGTAGMLAYAQGNEPWTYFELDPTVIRIATDGPFFTYVKDTSAQLRIVPGDARLSLGHIPDHAFDMLIIDAFGSDWIPSHLLTREALTLYQRKLAPDGFIVFHLSNQFLDLWPVVAGLAQDARLDIVRKQRIANAQDNAQGILGSRWAMMTQHTEGSDFLVHQFKWSRVPAGPVLPLWTDEQSSVVGLFQW